MINPNYVDGLELRIKELTAERDSALAQNAELVKAIKAIENDCIECCYDDETGYFISTDVISNAIDLTHCGVKND